ncbi:MAG: universal stress protein [Rhodothermales bacterium]
MQRFQRMLVPVDFSPPSHDAMAAALDLAASQGARVDLVHVFEPPDFPALYGASALKVYGKVPDLREAAKHSLHEWLSEAHRVHPDVASHFREGHAASEIVAAAESLKSDLIVLSTHGHTGLKHVLLGSVAEHVVRVAPCPVLVMRAHVAPERDDDATERPALAEQNA